MFVRVVNFYPEDLPFHLYLLQLDLRFCFCSWNKSYVLTFNVKYKGKKDQTPVFRVDLLYYYITIDERQYSVTKNNMGNRLTLLIILDYYFSYFHSLKHEYSLYT